MRIVPPLSRACSIQLSHAPSDRDLAERHWADRLEGAYAYRTLADSGALLANVDTVSEADLLDQAIAVPLTDDEPDFDR